jgi:hypothetical protein
MITQYFLQFPLLLKKSNSKIDQSETSCASRDFPFMENLFKMAALRILHIFVSQLLFAMLFDGHTEFQLPRKSQAKGLAWASVTSWDVVIADSKLLRSKQFSSIFQKVYIQSFRRLHHWKEQLFLVKTKLLSHPDRLRSLPLKRLKKD